METTGQERHHTKGRKNVGTARAALGRQKQMGRL